MIFRVDKKMPNNRAFVKGDAKDLYPGEVVKVQDGIIIKDATVETRYDGGAVVSFGARGA